MHSERTALPNPTSTSTTDMTTFDSCLVTAERRLEELQHKALTPEIYEFFFERNSIGFTSYLYTRIDEVGFKDIWGFMRIKKAGNGVDVSIGVRTAVFDISQKKTRIAC
jgi:hypothetical protein